MSSNKKKKYPYSVCKRLSKYGEHYTLRYHIREKEYHLTGPGIPMLKATFSKDERDKAVAEWERLEYGK